MSARPAYLRYPHLHGDLLTFVAADDVWIAPVSGGRAWRLTSDIAPVRQPRFSPDGARIAYVSHRDGHPEVMVAEVDSGDVRRLTHWGAQMTYLLGWTADGRIIVASNGGEANIRHTVVKLLSLDGSWERPEIGMASGIALHGDGRIVLTTPWSRPPAHWKRYRGGTAPRLWLAREGAGAWEQLLTEDEASITDPMWLGDALVFASDRAATFPDRADEQANLWIWETPGEGAPRLLTHQTAADGYVRDATTDGNRIVWHSRGRIRILDSLDGAPRTIDVTLPGTAAEPLVLGGTRRLDAFAPDHDASGSLVTWRGKAFWLAHREGPARALLADSGIRAREPIVLGRTGFGAVASDADGEDGIDILSLDGTQPPRRLLSGDLGRILHLAASPGGDRIAAISHDGTVRVVDVAGGSTREVSRSGRGEARTPRFSPDGRYLAWTQPVDAGGDLHAIWIADIHAAGPAIRLTTGQYNDRSPDFTHDGRHLVFLSDRTFDPHYNAHAFDLAFAGATRPWLIPLSATEPAPFGPSADGWPVSPAPKPAEDERVVCPDLDADGAEERIVPFPVPSAEYRDLRCVDGGVVWIAVHREQGVLGSRRAGVKDEPTPDSLERWSFADRRADTLVEAVDRYAVSGDGRRLTVRHRDAVTVVPADRPAKDDAVKVDLGRLRFTVDRPAEWRQMFDENARIMRDHFWRADMDGVDWDAVVARWRPVVESALTHDDVVDILWETVGELNTSHAYVTPSAPLGNQTRRLGFLGADLSPAEGGWRIDRILPGESSEPNARSPLRQAGVGAREGDLIVAVDGKPVDEVAGPAASLVGAADKPVELTLRREGEDDRRVVVVPLPDEEVLRYQDWVRSRRAYVSTRSGGRLGYVHVPDMQSYGWAQLHRDLRIATDAEGVIADVRYNRGGHTSQLVVERLASRVIAWNAARHFEQFVPDPDRAPRGPVVLVANEFSGSDGDIVNARAQALGVGPVVGVRTWGGVVGIDSRFDLVDGTKVTQPRYAYWLQGKGWGVENHGVDPDIEVVHTPAQLFRDDDPQLDRAIEEALRRLEAVAAAEAPPLPAPKVRPAS
ncbi:tricorn protease [Microbacterium paludicola]|uniref:Tricorn protease homolog n=1 Tax=Microbacterium paludicola TaxID=300019 RepID=A0A4Y9G077_9MICO|nr:S41 family peptidase [Microbacterium paludicola]MBF0815429.1 PDZ domain-containing protein [Microbacterium paludicola]TFU33967.1 tricorn protease [Microbacterium paludicola]